MKQMVNRSYHLFLAVLFLALFGHGIAQDLIVNAQGGEYEPIIHETIIEPFEEQFGVDVLLDPVGSASEDYARIRATNGSPGFDVAVMTASESLLGCREDLLTPLSEENVPNLAHLYPEIREAVGECGAPHEIQYMTLMYRTDRVDPPPTSWRALWDEQYTGRVIVPDIGNVMAVFLLQMASLMNGGDFSNLDPGFEAVAELASRARAVELASSIMVQYVEQDEAWLLPYWSARAQLYKDMGLPVDYVIPEEGTIPLLATLNVPTGAKNKELALEFVNFWLEKNRQEAWAQAYNVGSARGDLELPEEVATRQVTSPEDLAELHFPDLVEIGERRSEWTERWEREVTR